MLVQAEAGTTPMIESFLGSDSSRLIAALYREAAKLNPSPVSLESSAELQYAFVCLVAGLDSNFAQENAQALTELQEVIGL